MKFTSKCLIILICISFIKITLSACPNWCNKRGTCTAPSEGGGYCVCDMGYAGNDCSLRYCPSSFDVLNMTSNPGRRTVRLVTGNMGGSMAGTYSLSILGSDVVFNANANLVSSQDCLQNILSLNSIQDATCIREKVDETSGIGTYLISILKYPVLPYLNNIHVHYGNPPISGFNCDISNIDKELAVGPFCEFIDVAVEESIPEYQECGGHGICDDVIGKCACEHGFKGIACDDITDGDDRYTHQHDGPFFTGSLLKLKINRDKSKDYNIFSAQVNDISITTIRGDGLFSHHGEMRIQDGISSGLTSPTNDEYLKNTNFYSNIDSTNEVSKKFHFVSKSQDETVFSLSDVGSLYTKGSFSASNKDFTVIDGVTTMLSAKISGDLDVKGSTSLNSLSIGNDDMNSNHVTIKRTGTILELSSNQVDYDGPLFSIAAMNKEKGALIKATNNDNTVFELDSDGNLSLQGLNIASGGIEIGAGGLNVKAGGATINGGLSISSGGLSLKDQEFYVGSIQVTSPDNNVAKSLITATNTNAEYIGKMIDLTSNVNSDQSHFSYLSAQGNDGKVVFDISGDGSIETAGGVFVKGPHGMNVDHHSSLQGSVSISQLRISAGESIVIPSTASYVTIYDDNEFHTNNIKLSSINDGAKQGQILIISNSDSQPTTGDASIPTSSTLLLVFNGEQWKDVETLSAPIHTLKNIRKFEAENDLDIGNYTFTAGRFRASRMKKGSIPFVTNEGYLGDDEKLSYSKGVLTTVGMKIVRILTDVDMKGNKLNNGVFSNSNFIDSSISVTKLTIPKQNGLAYFKEDGVLTSSPHVTLDNEGRLLISSLHNDIDLTGHKIKNGAIVFSNITNSPQISVHELKLLGLKDESRDGSLLFLDNNGIVQSTMKDAFYDSDTGVLNIKKINGFSLIGSVDFNNNDINNVIINGGDINSDTLTVKGTTIFNSFIDKDSTSNLRLMLVDSIGKIKVVSNKDKESIKISNLSVNKLSLQGDMDGQGSIIKNIKLDSNTVDFGNPLLFEVGSLKVSSLLGNDDENVLVSVDKTGLLRKTPGIKLKINDDRTDFTVTGLLKANKLNVTDELILSQLPLKSILGTNKEGVIVAVNDLTLPSITIEKQLNILESGVISIQGLKSSLLATDKNGKIVSASNSSDNLDLSLNNLKSISGDIEILKVTSTAIINNLYLSSMIDVNSVTPSLMTVNSDGKITKLSSDSSILLPNTSTNTLVASESISTKSLIITDEDMILDHGKPLILNSNGKIITSNNLNTNEIRTDSLTVSDSATFNKLFIKNPVNLPNSEIATSVLSSINGEIQSTTNVILDSLTINKDIIVKGSLSTNSLKLSNYQSGVLIAKVNNGVASSNIESVSKLDVSSINAETAKINGVLSANSIQITQISQTVASSASSLVTIDSVGSLHSLSIDKLPSIVSFPLPKDASFESVSVNGDVFVNSLKISGLKKAGILNVDSVGKVSSMPIDSIEIDSLTVKNNLKTDGIIETNNMIISSLAGKKGNENGDRLLLSDENGQITITSSLRIKSKEDVITMNAKKIEINGVTDIMGSLYIGDSLNVQGSIVGSGPYMDSSDKRFKKNFTTYIGALDKVTSLNAVKYYHRIDEFPNRNLADGEQIGWIADEVELILPELVGKDNEGYKAVAYSRSSVLLAAALKELKEETTTKISSLKDELEILKIKVNKALLESKLGGGEKEKKKNN